MLTVLVIPAEANQGMFQMELTIQGKTSLMLSFTRF